MVAGRNILADLAAFLDLAAQDPCSALNSMSRAYPAEPLVVAPVGAHFTEPIRSNALLSNPSSILIFSQAQIVGLRHTYALPRDATDEVIEMVSDSRFDARDGGDVSVLNLHEECFMLVDKRNIAPHAFLETRPSQIMFKFHSEFGENGERRLPRLGSFMGTVLR